MKTPWDFLTIAVFAGLITLFLQRSVGETPDRRPILLYMVAAVGCAVTNYLGNNQSDIAAAAVAAATLGFIVRFLHPLEGWKGR